MGWPVCLCLDTVKATAWSCGKIPATIWDSLIQGKYCEKGFSLPDHLSQKSCIKLHHRNMHIIKLFLHLHVHSRLVKPGTHHAIFVFCWTQRRRKDDCRMVCAHQRRSSSVDFTNATVVGPIRKTNLSNNCCMVCAGQRHLSHQPTGHRPITVKHFRDA